MKLTGQERNIVTFRPSLPNAQPCRRNPVPSSLKPRPDGPPSFRNRNLRRPRFNSSSSPQRCRFDALAWGEAKLRENVHNDLFYPRKPVEQPAAIVLPWGRECSLRNEERRHCDHCRHVTESFGQTLHTALLMAGTAGE
jgi:hypothetical protein